jgi:hypothetical protein
VVGNTRNWPTVAAFQYMPHFVRRLLTLLGTIAASPWALGTVAVYALLWPIFDPGMEEGRED